MKLYELFTGDELKVAEKIQQRRYQLLIHSCIYYQLNQNIVTDSKWNEWSNDLKELQDHYPDIACKVTLYEYFKDWDGSTGMSLPITLSWVTGTANWLLNFKNESVVEDNVNRRKLF